VTERIGASARRASLLLAGAVAVLLPLVGLPREDDRSLRADHLYLYTADVVLIALAILALPRLVSVARRPRDREAFLWVGLFAWLVLAFAAHPSARGIDLLIRALAAAALYRTVADAGAAEARVFTALLGVTAVVQAAVGVMQFTAGHPVGLASVGELSYPLLEYAGVPMVRGTVGHEFILASLALVAAAALVAAGLGARRAAPWAIAVLGAALPLGLIYGRTIIAGVALGAASLAPRAVRDARARWLLAAFVCGAAFPAIVARDGWAGSLARGVASDRGPIVLEAVAIVAEQPVVGVGPGNYLAALRARPEIQLAREVQNAHDVPLLLAAEAGIPAGVLAAALIALIGIAAVRAGAPALTLYLVYLPWLILDALPYITPQGLVLTAFWLGLLRHAGAAEPQRAAGTAPRVSATARATAEAERPARASR
jgi:hypothetical protein